VANLYLALEYDLDLLPVINKIDLPSADVERVRRRSTATSGSTRSRRPGLGQDRRPASTTCSRRSSPTCRAQGRPGGAAAGAALRRPVRRLPRGRPPGARLRRHAARAGTIRLMHSEAEHEVEEVGYQRSSTIPASELEAGEVGYVIAGIKSLSGIAIGDTLTEAERRPRSRSPATARRSRWSSPRSTRCRPTTTRTSPRRSTSWLNDARCLREGLLGRPRLRLPLRLPRPAPPRRGPGAAASASTTSS
jgi:hypothetical protein